MTASDNTLVGYLKDQLDKPFTKIGGFVKMCILTFKALVSRPFQWKEFVLQCWFLIRVAFLPTLAVSIPLTVLRYMSVRRSIRETADCCTPSFRASSACDRRRASRSSARVNSSATIRSGAV